MRRLCLLSSLLVLAACERAEPRPPSLRQQRVEAEQSAATAEAAVRGNGAAPACGTTPRVETSATAVLLNARQCLSCRDLGYMLRRLTPLLAANPTPPLIVVPSTDTISICPFLRQERVRLPVLSVPDADGSLAEARTLVLYTRRGQGVDSVRYALNGTDLLKQLAAKPRFQPPPPTAQPSGEP